MIILIIKNEYDENIFVITLSKSVTKANMFFKRELDVESKTIQDSFIPEEDLIDIILQHVPDKIYDIMIDNTGIELIADAEDITIQGEKEYLFAVLNEVLDKFYKDNPIEFVIPEEIYIETINEIETNTSNLI